jgi:hypothetical protein
VWASFEVHSSWPEGVTVARPATVTPETLARVNNDVILDSRVRRECGT